MCRATFLSASDAHASFAHEEPQPRSESSVRSRVQIYAAGAVDKSRAAAADELSLQNVRQTRAPRPHQKILVAMRCPQPPTREIRPAKPSTATSPARQFVPARPAVVSYHGAVEKL